MKWIAFALTIGTVAGLIAYTPQASGQGDGDAAPIYGIKIPTGYRDWRVISVANGWRTRERSTDQTGERSSDQGLS